MSFVKFISNRSNVYKTLLNFDVILPTLLLTTPRCDIRMFWCSQFIFSLNFCPRVHVDYFVFCFSKLKIMDLSTLMSTFVGHILEFVASTSIGQFAIKKFDALLWTLERPATYCVDGKSSGYNRKLSGPVFWTVLINIQIFRVALSTVLIRFNQSPIEPKDIVIRLQKWRRYLRSIRFRGLRQIREGESNYANGNDGKIFHYQLSVVCTESQNKNLLQLVAVLPANSQAKNVITTKCLITTFLKS